MYQRIRNISVLIALLAVLSACGNEAAPPATPTPELTPLIDLSKATSTSIATSTTAPTATSVPGDPAASPVPGQRTVGDIADKMSVAWTNVTSYRVTSVNRSIALATPLAGATPLAESPSIAVVDEFQLPSKRHRIQSENGHVTLELIVIDGIIYARGSSIPGVSPGGDPTKWMVIGEALIDPSSPFGEMYGALLTPVTAPYSGLSDEERGRIARPAGLVVVDGRSCSIYETADTTVIGERVTILIAIGDDDLPCSIETHVASTVNVSTFSYNVPLTIEPPIAAE